MATPVFFVDRDCQAIDTNEDGLSDVLESSFGTHPYRSDTDEDGIPDGVEDANKNGITDIGETNPLEGDTDNDKMPDGYQLANSFNPIYPADAIEDADGDGELNF